MTNERQNPGNVFPTKNRCEECGAAFTTDALLRDHMIEHSASATPEQQAEAQERQNQRKP